MVELLSTSDLGSSDKGGVGDCDAAVLRHGRQPCKGDEMQLGLRHQNDMIIRNPKNVRFALQKWFPGDN